jgi:hypothetical protein
MKKIFAVIVITTLLASAPGAAAATKVKISPQFKVSKKNPVISIKVSGLPTDHGIYISQCMAPSKKAGATLACNPAEYSKLWISNVEADQQMGAKPSNSKLTLKVDKYFKDGDCVHTKCVIYVTADHNASDDRTEDQFIPFKFDGILPF